MYNHKRDVDNGGGDGGHGGHGGHRGRGLNSTGRRSWWWYSRQSYCSFRHRRTPGTQPQQLWSCSSRIVLEVVRVCHQVVNDISEYKRLCSRLRGWPMPTQPPTTLRGCMPPSSFLIEANTEPRWGYWGCCCLPRSESLRAGASLPCPPFCGLCVMMTIVVVVMMMIMRPTKVCHSIKTLKTGQIDFIWCTTTLFFSLRQIISIISNSKGFSYNSLTVRRKENRC